MDVVEKAEAICEAWRRVTGKDAPTRIAVTYPLAQADFETVDGEAWALARNWGATDYRSLGLQELAAFHSGDLKPGMWLHTDGTWGSARRPDDVAQLHLDTHPGGGSYPMWFAAFADDAGGATYFLRIVLRMIGQMLSDPDATLAQYATAVYCHGYFEGFHAGARPVKDRTLPLTAPEQANVDEYVKNLSPCLASLERQLAAKGWQPPATIPAPPPTDPNPGGESGSAQGDDEDPLPHEGETETKAEPPPGGAASS